MRTAAPRLFPLFRSQGQARLLAHLFLQPEADVPLRSLARHLGLDPSVVSREVKRLEQAGIVSGRSVGRARLVRPNRESPIYPELSGLIQKTFGPVPVLRELVSQVAEVEEAYIYGSWASRYVGNEGEAPRDIDLLVVGTPRRREISRVARRATEALGLEVSPTVVAPEDWRAARTGFIRSVKRQPVVTLVDRR